MALRSVPLPVLFRYYPAVGDVFFIPAGFLSAGGMCVVGALVGLEGGRLERGCAPGGLGRVPGCGSWEVEV